MHKLNIPYLLDIYILISQGFMLNRLQNILTNPVVVASVIAGILVVGFQRLGVLEPIELKAFDHMVQRRSALNPDPRLLIVAFTENDIQKLKQSSPNGNVLDTVLSKLERYQAKVIGLDFFRDVPVEPGHQKLLTRLNRVRVLLRFANLVVFGSRSTTSIRYRIGSRRICGYHRRQRWGYSAKFISGHP